MSDTNQKFVHVKMLRNVMTPLTDEHANILMPPMRLVEHEVSHLQAPRGQTQPGAARAMLASFDMEQTHRVPVPTLIPRIPVRTPNMPQAWFDKLTEAAYERAIQDRVAAEELRDMIRHYVTRGVIEIVKDESGFLEEEDTFDAMERELINSKREADEQTLANKSKGSK